MTRIHDLMGEAKRAGVRWGDVIAAAQEVRARDEAYNLEGLRAFVAHQLGIRGAWRTGLERLAEKLRNSCRDYTALPGYDQIADQLRAEFPEFAGLDAGELFELALDGEPPPTPCDYLEQALGRLSAHAELLAIEECPHVGDW